MHQSQHDTPLWKKIKAFFCRNKNKLFVGQLGIYHYLWASDTIHEDSHGIKYDIFTKIKIVEIYEDLVEIESIDIKINDSASQDVINIIKNNFPKYVNPKYVKWQIKREDEKTI